MLDDSWTRIQVYVPEPIRYKLRQITALGGPGASDSKRVRNLLYIVFSDDPTQILDLYDTIKSTK